MALRFASRLVLASSDLYHLKPQPPELRAIFETRFASPLLHSVEHVIIVIIYAYHVNTFDYHHPELSPSHFKRLQWRSKKHYLGVIYEKLHIDDWLSSDITKNSERTFHTKVKRSLSTSYMYG